MNEISSLFQQNCSLGNDVDNLNTLMTSAQIHCPETEWEKLLSVHCKTNFYIDQCNSQKYKMAEIIEWLQKLYNLNEYYKRVVDFSPTTYGETFTNELNNLNKYLKVYQGLYQSLLNTFPNQEKILQCLITENNFLSLLKKMVQQLQS